MHSSAFNLPRIAARLIVALLVGMLVAAAATCSAVAADDFRVETKIFPGKEIVPSSEITTLFCSGKVYDYLNKPAEVTVFDPQHARVILLNPVRKLRSELTYDDLEKFSARVKELAAKKSDELLKFAAEPKFDTHLDEKSGELVFASAYMTYQVATQKSELPTAVKQYQEFSDVSARLNTIINRGSMPPFPRLEVNKTLINANLLPRQVQLTILPRQHLTGKSINVRSEHQFFWRLVDADRQRIDQTASSLVTFTPVKLDEYLRRGDDQAKK